MSSNAPALYCGGCGRKRVVGVTAAVTRCVCGSTALQSWQPQGSHTISVTGPGGQQVKP